MTAADLPVPFGDPGSVAGLRHDLRHELATVRALLAAAGNETGFDRTRLRSLLGTAGEELEHAVALVEALVDATSPASAAPGPVPAELADDGSPVGERCDLSAVLHAAARSAESSGRTVRVVAPPGLAVGLAHSAATRVVRNLLGNAVAATRPGGLVELRADRADVTPEDAPAGTSSPYVRLEVHDDGPGPDAAGFLRAGGQGLDIVRSIVLPSGGWLVLGSSPSGGACAVVVLRAAGEEIRG